jgi:hypothetical protein
MANYYASARTSYFLPKDASAFEDWADGLPDTSYNSYEKDGSKLYALFFDGGDCAGIPNYIYDEDQDDYIEFDIYAEIQDHLADGWSVSFTEAGAEKLRYINCYAVLVTQDDIKSLNLDGWIAEQVKAAGVEYSCM